MPLGQCSLILWDGSSIVRSGCDCEQRGGRELGLSGMVNTCESLINAVIEDKPKMLIGLDQKVGGQVQVFRTHLTQTLRHRQRGET